MLRGIGFVLLLIVAAVLFASNKSVETSSPKSTPHTVTIPPPPDPRTLVTISDYSWGKTGFGAVGQGNFTIKNDNSFSVKDILVRCSFYANSGTNLGNGEATIYEVIGAKKSRTFKEVNLGFIHSQSSKASCRVVTIGR